MGHQTESSAADTTTARQGRRSGFKLGPGQLGFANTVALSLIALAQIVTISITWDLWQHRGLDTTFPNLPWLGNPPQIDYGLLLIGSLLFLLLCPRFWGWTIHLLILAAAIGSDQFRLQPQVLSPLLLISACLFPKTKTIAVWFLIAMWFWAGIHKLLSPDWMGEVTYYMLLSDSFKWGEIHAWEFHYLFAWMIAISEIGLAVLAWRRPKLAAPFCFVMHLGIAVFLIVIDWNFSVLPWNFCTAIIGAWMLWTVSPSNSPVNFPASGWGRVGVALLLLMPTGFYLGMLRHSVCHVLYSSNCPDAVITNREGSMICSAIEELRVPFPHERKAYLDYFRLTGEQGDKLHIKDYRFGFGDEYFVLNTSSQPRSITRDQFFDSQKNGIAAVAMDNRRQLFELNKSFHQTNGTIKDDQQVGRILKRKPDAMVWAIKFPPNAFKRQWLKLIGGLPNLEQIQLSQCDVTDGDLKHVAKLIRLKGIGLNRTAVTDAGLSHLKNLPELEFIEHQDTQITEAAIQSLLSK